MLERSPLGRLIAALPLVLRHTYLLLVVMLAWVPFRTEDWGEAMIYFGALAGQGDGGVTFDQIYAPQLALLLPLGAIIAVWPLIAESRPAAWIVRRGAAMAHPAPRVLMEPIWIAALLVLCAADLATGSYNPFIYFRF